MWKKRLELEMAKIDAEIPKIKKQKLFGLFVQIARTLTVCESGYDNDGYQEEVTEVWKLLFEMLKELGNRDMFNQAVEELCETLDLSLEEFSKEWAQDYGLHVSDFKGD